ncbi:unnamed protein product [Polarella glacialis]|uniref:Uncharacterized protein n=1 Tax=Polarella glacialis TaxID=89957 RepID=A0A813FQY1_POLGL|nr:unnamed protein product [Polarella glacialis]
MWAHVVKEEGEQKKRPAIGMRIITVEYNNNKNKNNNNINNNKSKNNTNYSATRLLDNIASISQCSMIKIVLLIRAWALMCVSHYRELWLTRKIELMAQRSSLGYGNQQ